MNIPELKVKVEQIIIELKDHGKFPKENQEIDFKLKLKSSDTETATQIFMMSFAKDILSFANSRGGIILIGFDEDKTKGTYSETGLDEKNLSLLEQIDLNDITQQFVKMTNVGITLDLQQFNIGTKKFFYLLIEKSGDVLIPKNDFLKIGVKKGEVIYRASGKNEVANITTEEFSRFMNIKTNENNKEYMTIWSKIFPDMVDINPKNVLMLNLRDNMVYGLNNKEKKLIGAEIDIDNTHGNVFNIILNAISAGEIGKITTNEGKPLYKIVGELHNNKEHIIQSSVLTNLQSKAKYKITNLQMKSAMHYLGWVTNAKFPVENPPEGIIVEKYKEYIWIETVDNFSNRTKVYFSSKAIEKLIEIIDDKNKHLEIFNKLLDKNPNMIEQKN